MAPFPPLLQRASRAHPFLTLGIVTGLLLAALVALPFLARTRGQRTRHAAIPGDSRVQVATASGYGATRHS
jgi:acyl dehydratase